MAKKAYAGLDFEQKQDDPLYIRRHSLAHILAQAVQKLHPGTRLGFGPPVENGFYYDFLFPEPISDEDFPALEKEMRRIINEKQVFERTEMEPADAVTMLQGEGEGLKAEYCQDLASRGEQLSFYRNGVFNDLCAGPHVENTGQIPTDCFQLDSLAGAYWRGDEKREQLTRIYGLAFGSKAELKEFIRQREEARKFDHRKLGKELEIYMMSDQVGPGLPLWLPNGTVLREELENLAKEWEFAEGYQRVATPHVTDGKLFETSGHLAHYKADMFPAMVVDENREYYLKPMNCPFHHLIFGHRPRSYREMPLRLAEYGQCYRYEGSGALAGLLRVRGMCMNDAHIYCTPEQLDQEFAAVLALHKRYYDMFRLDAYWVRFSKHDPARLGEKYVDMPDDWLKSEAVIQNILEKSGIDFTIAEGEGAFYGPKVDFQVRNVLGREETASTNQLDFVMPTRFNLTYIGQDGAEHTPYCIHRAPLGTHERFLAFLIEHFKGAFPTWMAPEQVRVVPVHLENYGEYAQQVADRLRRAGFRAEADLGADSFNKKIRNAATGKVPNVFIVGERERDNQEVTWRRYCVKEQVSVKFEQALAALLLAKAERRMDNFADVEVLAGT